MWVSCVLDGRVASSSALHCDTEPNDKPCCGRRDSFHFKVRKLSSALSSHGLDPMDVLVNCTFWHTIWHLYFLFFIGVRARPIKGSGGFGLNLKIVRCAIWRSGTAVQPNCGWSGCCCCSCFVRYNVDRAVNWIKKQQQPSTTIQVWISLRLFNFGVPFTPRTKC